MTRKKVKLAFIANDAARKATFKKRKVGLMKKVSELSTLCGVDACAIVYSPFDNRPEVWPSPSGIQRVLSKFKQMPEMEKCKKMVNQESFLRQRINKGAEQLKRMRKDNREKEVTQAMYQCLMGQSLLHLTMMDLTDLGWLIDQNVMEINRRSEMLKNGGVPPPPQQPLLLQPAPASVAQEAGPSGVQHEPQMQQPMQEEANQRSPFVDSIQNQQWFMDFTIPTPLPPQEPVAFVGDELVMPSGDGNSLHAQWSGGFYP